MPKHDVFTFKNNKLLCWRLGAMNAQKQKHYNRDVETFAGKGTHKPPESRGVWAFPYPHYDYFFCWHQWERHLPKLYKSEFYNDESLSDEEVEKIWQEKDELIKKIQKRFRPSKFYCGEFYSHIFPDGYTDFNNWFYWTNVREWAKVARKTMVTRYRYGDRLIDIGYTVDHLEIFVTRGI